MDFHTRDRGAGGGGAGIDLPQVVLSQSGPDIANVRRTLRKSRASSAIALPLF